MTANELRIITLIDNALEIVKVASYDELIYVADTLRRMRIVELIHEAGYDFNPGPIRTDTVREVVESLAAWQFENLSTPTMEMTLADGTPVRQGDNIQVFVTFYRSPANSLSPIPRTGEVTYGFVGGYAVWNCYGSLETAAAAYESQKQKASAPSGIN